MKKPEPILVAKLFPEMRRQLVELLSGLSTEEWERATTCKGWSVKDVALHLLAIEIQFLSMRRDNHFPPGSDISSFEDLVALINRQNSSWVEAARRISPRLLCDLLDFLGPQVEEAIAARDPHAGGVTVDWAGSKPAPLWMDTAREFTERWHHQQQIRDAVGKPGLKEPRFLAPLLDTFVRGLPNTFRDVRAAEGTTIKLTLTGDAGGVWFLVRGKAGWELFLDSEADISASVTMDQDTAWRLFTKGIIPEEAKGRAEITGDPNLTDQVLDMISVIASR